MVGIEDLEPDVRDLLIEQVNGYLKSQKLKELESYEGSNKIAATDIKIEGPNKEAINVYFGFNSTEITSTEKEKLDRAILLIKSHEEYKVELVGYTDNKGDFKVNRLIATSRADNVYAYLLKNGVKENQMISYGRAFLQQAGGNDSELGRKLNRRVEVLIYR